MTFEIDENLPEEAATLFQQRGYDAATIREQEMSGSSDRRVASILQEEKRVLVTLDTDFADIRTYPPEDFAGIIVLRLNQQDRKHVLTALERLLPVLAEEPLSGCLWIVGENNLHIR